MQALPIADSCTAAQVMNDVCSCSPMRSQLEALLAEMAGLAAAIERLARENGGWQELLRHSVQCSCNAAPR